MSKRPSFQFYPKDFLADRNVAVMTNGQVGGYMKLLCYMWQEDDCCLSNDQGELEAISNLDSTTLQRVLKCFVEKGNKISHKRLQVERKKQDEWRRKSRLGGLASAKKRAKGGSRVVQPKGNTSTSTSTSNKSSKEDSASQKKEHGNKNVNNILEAIRLKVGVGDFKESKKMQRIHGMNLYRLMEKISPTEFGRRLDIILSDSFRQKNCGSLNFIYKEIKGFIEPETVKSF